MSGRALRTLGVAYRVLSEDEVRFVAAALTEGGDAELADLEKDLVLAGVVGIKHLCRKIIHLRYNFLRSH